MIGERRYYPDTRIIDEDINAPEMLDHAERDAAGFLFVGEVGQDGGQLIIPTFQPADCLIERGLINVHHRDTGSGAEQTPSNSESNSLRRACDYRDSSGQVQVNSPRPDAAECLLGQNPRG